MEAAIAAFQRSQQGVRLSRMELDATLNERDEIEASAAISFRTDQPSAQFLLDPRLQLHETRLDGSEVRSERFGPLVRIPSQPGDHYLAVRWSGSLPANGGLGLAGSSFDMNLNLLWAPVLLWGTRLDVELRLHLPQGARVILPSVAQEHEGSVLLRSVTDVPLVGGRIRGSRVNGKVDVYSLVRDDVAPLSRIAENVIRWLEEKWGPEPYSPVRVIETWRRERGAYAREGLVVTPDWTKQSDREIGQRLAHEVTHNWWGMDTNPGEGLFSDDWLSEGLATFSEYLWLRDRVGEAAAQEFRSRSGTSLVGLRGSLANLSPWSDTGWSLSRYGALLALTDLEQRVPDLLGVLRTYRDRHRGSFVTTQSLVSELSRFVPQNWLEEHFLSDRAWPGDLQDLGS